MWLLLQRVSLILVFVFCSSAFSSPFPRSPRRSSYQPLINYRYFIVEPTTPETARAERPLVLDAQTALPAVYLSPPPFFLRDRVAREVLNHLNGLVLNEPTDHTLIEARHIIVRMRDSTNISRLQAWVRAQGASFRLVGLQHVQSVVRQHVTLIEEYNTLFRSGEAPERLSLLRAHMPIILSRLEEVLSYYIYFLECLDQARVDDALSRWSQGERFIPQVVGARAMEPEGYLTTLLTPIANGIARGQPELEFFRTARDAMGAVGRLLARNVGYIGSENALPESALHQAEQIVVRFWFSAGELGARYAAHAFPVALEHMFEYVLTEPNLISQTEAVRHASYVRHLALLIAHTNSMVADRLFERVRDLARTPAGLRRARRLFLQLIKPLSPDELPQLKWAAWGGEYSLETLNRANLPMGTPWSERADLPAVGDYRIQPPEGTPQMAAVPDGVGLQSILDGALFERRVLELIDIMTAEGGPLEGLHDRRMRFEYAAAMDNLIRRLSFSTPVEIAAQEPRWAAIRRVVEPALNGLTGSICNDALTGRGRSLR